MQRRVTLADVAREAGVSIKTASRVLNGAPTVGVDLRNKVHNTATRLRYRPNRAAAMMRSGHSGTVGFISKDLANPFYSTVAAGIADVIETTDRLLITCSSEGSPERQSKLIDAVLAHRPDGLVLTPSSEIDELLHHEVERQTPIVAVDEVAPGVRVDTVTFDNFTASRDGVLAALEMGGRELAVISPDGQTTMPLRRAGAASAAAELGLSVPSERICTGTESVAQARAAASRILDLPNPPDVIFCANNIAAVGVADEVVSRRGNVILVSFDDFPLSAALPVPVVVISHDTREMGRVAARLLLDRIANPESDTRSVTLGVSIHVTGDGRRRRPSNI